jgi:hypothetical protein
LRSCLRLPVSSPACRARGRPEGPESGDRARARPEGAGLVEPARGHLPGWQGSAARAWVVGWAWRPLQSRL